MRLGASERIQAIELDKKRGGLQFAEYLTDPENTIYVGLVGGSDPASINVRQAQSFLRFDRRPSYFSTVFLFTGEGDDILECRLVGADPACPENQGVVRESAGIYRQNKDWPNKALIGFTFLPVAGGRTPVERVQEVIAGARNTKAVRERYDLWQMIACWQPFIFEPSRNPNPLIGHYPHPGAAYVRWALSLVNLEAAPGAMDELDAPEHFWASANFWYRGSDASVGVRVSLVRAIGDPGAKLKPPRQENEIKK